MPSAKVLNVYRGDGLNLYAYVKNNPIMWVDPSGYNKHDLKDLDYLNSSEYKDQLRKNIEENFSEDEIKKLKESVVAYEQGLKDMGMYSSQIGPATSGVYNKATGKMEYFNINDFEGNTPGDFNDLLKSRLDNMPQDIKASYTNTKGAGTHAEIYSANEILNYIDKNGGSMDDYLIYVNYRKNMSPSLELPFETCNHCKYLLQGFNILSDI